MTAASYVYMAGTRVNGNQPFNQRLMPQHQAPSNT